MTDSEKFNHSSAKKFDNHTQFLKEAMMITMDTVSKIKAPTLQGVRSVPSDDAIIEAIQTQIEIDRTSKNSADDIVNNITEAHLTVKNSDALSDNKKIAFSHYLECQKDCVLAMKEVVNINKRHLNLMLLAIDNNHIANDQIIASRLDSQEMEAMINLDEAQKQLNAASKAMMRKIYSFESDANIDNFTISDNIDIKDFEHFNALFSYSINMDDELNKLITGLESNDPNIVENQQDKMNKAHSKNQEVINAINNSKKMSDKEKAICLQITNNMDTVCLQVSESLGHLVNHDTMNASMTVAESNHTANNSLQAMVDYYSTLDEAYKNTPSQSNARKPQNKSTFK